MTRKIEVALGERTYTVAVGDGILVDEKLYALPESARVVLVCDAAVVQTHAPVVTSTLGQRLVTTLEVPSGEESKSWEQLRRLVDAFATVRLTRADCVVVLGGGMVCDLAGCAAAWYMRGIAHVMLPTTLLAQVDAAVGGKTAINLAAGKNLVGAFHQPSAVLADVGTLATMPQREYVAGLAECVKHGLLQPALLEFLEQYADELVNRTDPTLLGELVAANVALKAAIVGADEREAGTRAHLNLGHTFAHGFEAAQGYAGLAHGEAVAIGLVAACRLGARLGVTDASLATRIATLLAQLGLPTTLPELDRKAVHAAMTSDKKAVGNTLHFVLCRTPGDVFVSADVSRDDVDAVLDELATSEVSLR